MRAEFGFSSPNCGPNGFALEMEIAFTYTPEIELEWNIEYARANLLFGSILIRVLKVAENPPLKKACKFHCIASFAAMPIGRLESSMRESRCLFR